MLIKLAWRNIWRNKRRSLVVLLSVIVGVNSLLFMDGLTNGMIYQMLANQISNNISHIQIHKNGFTDNKVIQSNIPDPLIVEDALKNNPSVKSYSKRVVTFGLLSSATNSAGVFLNGIIPKDEIKVSNISNSIVEGEYFTGGEREIVLGTKLAEKLEVGLGDKVVALSNMPTGKIGSEVFRITGLYKTPSSEFDKSFIYIPIKTAQSMLQLDDKVFEFAIVTKNINSTEMVKNELLAELGSKYEVQSYKDLLPLLIIWMDMYKESLVFINFIVGLALIFGIINSMLMAVYERINEFGVLMAIGMKNIKMFFMVVFEAVILGIFGTLIGLASGLLINWPISIIGIDLSLFAEGLNSYGVGAVIYPTLSFENFIMTLLMIPVVSVLGAIYPAYKAIKLDPIYAIRYV